MPIDKRNQSAIIEPMSNLSTENQNKLRQAITEYMAAGRSANTSAIAEYVKRKLDFKPSRTTIGTILRDMGYQPIEQPRWVWRSK